MQLKITTFNVENLFNRYAFLNQPWTNERYETFVAAVDVASIASRKGDLVPEATTHIQRNNTALAIEEVNPDILAVQEIENIYTLRNFNHDYLNDMFDQVISLDGNDPRGIDVGLLVKRNQKVQVQAFRTHIDDAEKGKTIIRESRPGYGYVVHNAVFSRDCLEVDIDVNGTLLTLLINHFKAQDDKKTSIERRKEQARRVADLAKAAKNKGRKPIVMGDLNMDSQGPANDKSLEPLTKSFLKDTLKSVPANDHWTHYYAYEKSTSRLDYILTDPGLTVTGVDVFRKGLTTKCKQYTGPRFPTIGPENTEASDHCPTSVTINV